MATQPKTQASTNTAMQVAFQTVNYAATSSGTANVIYITNDATYNKIDLQIALNTGSVTLTPGTITDPNTIPPANSGTVMYLDLSSLNLSTTLFNQLEFTADNWHFQLFPDDNAVGMTPTQTITLSAGTSGIIAIHIAKLEIDSALSTPTVQLYMSYYNVKGITGEYAAFVVAIQNRPDVTSGNLPDVLDVSLSSNTIINSYAPPRTVSNSFQLEFSAADNAPEVTTAPAGPKETSFTVSLVYGKPGDTFGYGALTDVPDALKIVATLGDNADAWQLTFNKDLQSPNWTLQPPPGSLLVGTGVESIVSFNFDAIQTPYQPGPTAMLVSYKNVPGYQDGVYTLVLNKLPHVIINTPLTVTPNPAYFQPVNGNEQASVLVEWTAEYQDSFILAQDYATYPLTPDTTQFPATLTSDPTNFTLTAYGAGGTQNVDIQNVSAVVLPVINSLIGHPTEVYAGQESQDVSLSWAVDTPGQVTISSSADPIHSVTSSAQNNLTQTVTQPQMFTLKPVTQESALTLTRRVGISAFNLSPQNYNLSGAAIGAAASPSAPFAAFTSGNQVIIVDTVQFSQITTVSISKSPGAITFSKDGSLMVTANGDDTVSIVPVTIQNGMPSFGSPSNVNVGGAPQQVFVTPDNSHIYVSVDPGGGKTGQLVVLKASNNVYALDTQVAVGNAPRGLAVQPSGARIYVANSADNTISIIGVQGDTLTVISPSIQSVTGTPTGLAISPYGSLLLATCATSKSVVVIDTNYPNTATRQTLTVGNQPTQIAVTPTGAYAFVTNQGDGTLSLINCSGLISETSVLGQPISVGTNPNGVTVSPDGLTVFVANSTGISVVTLQIYGAAQVVSGVAAEPTDVAAAPDGSAALVWHNAMLSVQAPVQPTGASWYSIASETPTPILAEVPIVQCVFHPDASAQQAFAVANNGPVLYIIDTSNPESPTFKEQQLTGGAVAAVAVVVSGDGQRLFVVAPDINLEYSLVVLEFASGGWTQQPSIQLYQGKTFSQVWMQATPDGKTILVIDGANTVFKAITWNATDQKYEIATTTIQISDPVALTILPDGSKAYVVGRATPSTITVIDIATLNAETLSLVQNFVNLQGLVASPDGARLFGTDLSAGAVRVFDPASLRILQTLPLAANVSQQGQGAAGVTITPDASRIFAVSTDSGTMSIFQQVPMD